MADIFYIDVEYNESNLYIGEIFELAVLSETSDKLFHSYISIQGALPWFYKKLCDIDETKLLAVGLPFRAVMKDLINFIWSNASSTPFIIAHGDWDFKMLAANLWRNECEFSGLHEFLYINSVEILLKKGMEQPGLSRFCKREKHSAKDDVRILQKVCRTYIEMRDIYSNFNSFECTIWEFDKRVVVSLTMLREFVKDCDTKIELQNKLTVYVRKKTCLTVKSVHKIAEFYFSFYKLRLVH